MTWTPLLSQRWYGWVLPCLVLLSFTLPVAASTPPVQTFVLPNGQRVFVQENHTNPIVTVDTWVNTGSINESTSNNGVSHFLEHLLFKGTEQFAPGAIDQWLENKGAEHNAATSQDFTHYYIRIASPFFKEALQAQSQMLLHANFPPTRS